MWIKLYQSLIVQPALKELMSFSIYMSVAIVAFLYMAADYVHLFCIYVN